MAFDFDTLFYSDFYDIRWTSLGLHRTVTWGVAEDQLELSYPAGETREIVVDPALYLDVFQTAFDLWDDALDHIAFEFTNEGNDADVALGIVEIDGPGAIYGLWGAQWNFSRFTDASIQFDVEDMSGGRLLTTALHEIGNILGLGDIWPTDALQSVQEDPFQTLFTGIELWEDDVAIIRAYYGETDAPTDLQFWGSMFADRLGDSAGNDSLFGLGGRDTLNGNVGDDSLLGGNGHDRLNGGAGFDTLLGGTGNDTLFGGSQGDRLLGGNGRDILNGQRGNDIIKGNAASDILRGGMGSDVLHGQRGNDHLFGNQGRDTLNGGIGDDRLVGGVGPDVFEFNGAFGNDTIVGFEVLNPDEYIDLSAVAAIAGYADLVDTHMRQIGNDVEIDTFEGNSILILNRALADLEEASFVF